MKNPSYEIRPATNGFIVEKNWLEGEHDYQSEKTIFHNWKEATEYLLDNPI